jgi:methionyl-tRNA formyltransferase
MYPYAFGDLLEARNTYFYTPYHGVSFLHEWMGARDAASAGAREKDAPPPRAGADVAGETRETATLIEEGFGQSDSALAIRDALIKRFEVTKRLYTSCRSDFRASPGARYDDISLYLRFAEMLEAHVQRSAHLPSLNALLKVMDTLSALVVRLDDHDRGRFARLVNEERRHVMALAARNGVSA